MGSGASTSREPEEESEGVASAAAALLSGASLEALSLDQRAALEQVKSLLEEDTVSFWLVKDGWRKGNRRKGVNVHFKYSGEAGLNYVCSTCRVPDSAAAMFEDFNQGKAQQRYNEVCRHEEVLQVLEQPAPLGYERMVVGIYQMPSPMKASRLLLASDPITIADDREFLWREWAALLPTEDGGQLYVSVAMTPSPEEEAAILPPNDKFVRGHLHLAATLARQEPGSAEVSAASVIMGDVRGSMPKAVQNMVAGNASSYLINFRDAHSR
ncbi:unnamed protein product [Durusdinium trenchii]|uniref:Uncharacterized protein n=1 Tax=Durusdinium trenchii TaxID=1381693 RepID=A0ABP0LKU8_9DINO